MRNRSKRRWKSPKTWVLIVAAVVVLGIVGVGILRTLYYHNLHAVSSVSASTTKYFTVDSGSGVRAISVNLRRQGLIRNTQAFETYVRSNDLNDSLQAGTYSLSTSMSVQQIVAKMVKGDVATNLLTILPGKRLDQIEQTFAKAGYSQKEIDEAFDPATYADHPLMADLPRDATLEGLLYPDSFQKEADTPAETIVRESLDEMEKYLSSDIIAGFGAQGLSVYQGLTMASIVEQESGDPSYQPTIAQVFLSRYKQGMMLGSDVTAFYAAHLAGQGQVLTVDSPYNTRIHTGLPPGPISNMTVDSLSAVAHPAGTDYLYFVAGDDGKVHFSHTIDEHNAAVQQFCIKKCAQ